MVAIFSLFNFYSTNKVVFVTSINFVCILFFFNSSTASDLIHS